MNAPVSISHGRWSLLEMVANFSAAGLNGLLEDLHTMVGMGGHNRKVALGSADRADPTYEEAVADTEVTVSSIRSRVDNLQLIMPCPHVKAAADHLKYWSRDESKIWDELFHRSCRLRDAITTEFREYVFYAYPKDKGKMVMEWEDSWKKVAGAFPDVKIEAYLAVDCYALQHPIASVFHSMRVAEHGLRALAAERRVRLPKNKPVEWATWQEIIRALDGEIKVIASKKPGAAKDAALEFYSGARADLNGFKDEYRNAVMHVRATYDEYQALRALANVRHFMERLAAKIDHANQRIKWGRF